YNSDPSSDRFSCQHGILVTLSFISLSMYRPNMSRNVEAIVNGPFNFGEAVVQIYERKVTAYSNNAKVDAQKKYIGYRAYVIIVKD
ncbi:MAG: DUF2080 family transposase-associated protein, partial [Methanofastidiosum sp.]